MNLVVCWMLRKPFCEARLTIYEEAFTALREAVGLEVLPALSPAFPAYGSADPSHCRPRPPDPEVERTARLEIRTATDRFLKPDRQLPVTLSGERGSKSRSGQRASVRDISNHQLTLLDDFEEVAKTTTEYVCRSSPARVRVTTPQR